MLGRHLHIVTSQEQSTKQGYSVNKITANSNSALEILRSSDMLESSITLSLGNNDGVLFVISVGTCYRAEC